jgi:hypothetical protein
MAITLRRQLNDDEKQSVLKIHERKCFATGHLIPDGEAAFRSHPRLREWGSDKAGFFVIYRLQA